MKKTEQALPEQEQQAVAAAFRDVLLGQLSLSKLIYLDIEEILVLPGVMDLDLSSPTLSQQDLGVRDLLLLVRRELNQLFLSELRAQQAIMDDSYQRAIQLFESKSFDFDAQAVADIFWDEYFVAREKINGREENDIILNAVIEQMLERIETQLDTAFPSRSMDNAARARSVMRLLLRKAHEKYGNGTNQGEEAPTVVGPASTSR